MPQPTTITLSGLIAEAEAVEAAIRESARAAILEHKRAGFSVVGRRNGRVEIVAPEDINIDEVNDGTTVEN